MSFINILSLLDIVRAYYIIKNMNKKEKAKFVLEQLRKRYPVIPTLLHARNPFERLIATILSAQSTDDMVNRITPHLFARWKTPYDFLDADVHEVESIIRAVGFYKNKAKHILGTSRKLVENFNGEVPQTLEELITLDGVARKTANVVLSSSFGKNEGIAVDTHVLRITRKIGLTKHTTPDKVEQDLMKLFPRKDWGDLNKMCVWFGREVCNAKKPQCAHCEMGSICDSFGHNIS